MKRKIQFINSYGKFHEYNFIREVLPHDDITVYSDTGYASFATAEVEDYYVKHSINVVKAKDYASIGSGIIRKALNLFSGIKIIIKSRSEKYDYCFVHYLSTRRAVLSLFVPKKTKLVLITYGSDILRRKNFNNIFFKSMLNKADLIVFNSGNLRYTFEKSYGKKYDEKCVDIAFPCASFKRLELNISKHTKKEAKEHFSLPLNKTIVVCGHTSTSDEQHKKLIDAIQKIDKDHLEQCHFVFPMTYGSEDYINYRESIKQILKNTNLSYTVLENYLGYDEMSLLHISSDIHITSITTDALSLFLSEELFAGAHLIYGEWLHYTEFEANKVGADTYKSFNDLPEIISKVIDGEGTKAPDNQKKIIEDINSNDRIAQSWQKYFDR